MNFRFKVAIFFVAIVQVALSIKSESESVKRADMDKNKAQLIKTRNDLVKTVESLKSKRDALQQVKRLFNGLRENSVQGGYTCSAVANGLVDGEGIILASEQDIDTAAQSLESFGQILQVLGNALTNG